MMIKDQGGIWIGDKDLNGEEEFVKVANDEFQSTKVLSEIVSDESDRYEATRRDFLKFLGFGLGAATIASCETPVKRAIPYTIQPEEIVPGVATYYASTIVKGGDFCPVLVKTREGRPIKIEGNMMSGITKGGTSARAQASVLSLYDTNRFRSPMKKNDASWDNMSWAGLDKAVLSALQSSSQIRIVTNTILSPTFKKVIEDFKSTYPSTEVVTYDPVSSSGLLDATEQDFGIRAIPSYHFDKADYVVSFNADFLGTWISPIEYTAAFNEKRKIKKAKGATMSRHVQVESHMSLTGSNADNRILVKPSEQGRAVAYLYNQISGENLNTSGLNDRAKSALSKVARSLMSQKGKSLVVSGSNDPEEQRVVNAINNALGNLGKTITLDSISYQRQGSDKAMNGLLRDMSNGNVDVLIVNNCNPVYERADGNDFAAAMAKVNTTVAMSYMQDETSAICDYVSPVHHVLESWGDVEAKRGSFGFIQPTIAPLFDTRQAEASMLYWSGDGSNPDKESIYRDYLRQSWSAKGDQAFWDTLLRDGVYQEKVSDTNSYQASSLNWKANATPSDGIEMSLYETINLGNGEYAGNPWLQELPDPVARTSWGNYLAVPISFDGVKKFKGFQNLKDGDLVNITVGDKVLENVPVIQQFGQMPGTVALALGYGRRIGGFALQGVGVDVNDISIVRNGYPQYFVQNVDISNKAGEEKYFSCVQYHHTMGVKAEEEGTGEIINADEAALAPGYGNIFQGYQGALVNRTIIRKTHVDDLMDSVHDLQHEREHHEYLNQQTLYPYDELVENVYSQGHHWGMHIDLTTCTGCGACAIACMAENNVPVVGKKQVSRHQEMTWLRIDRYYYGDVENPNTVYQPMMCQHCDNAPCENVCPVNASNHSSEGLNQMAYNRCVGTRYCANNCPYKVRRFNWLDYTTADIFPANQVEVNNENDFGEVPFGADNLTRMVLNPDVTVRSRGVIEKCSFCVQRIQEAKLSAKVEERVLNEKDLSVACQSACPVGAITFGDRNWKQGDFHDKWNSELNYQVLEEVNTRSSVMYTMKIHNKDESLTA